MPEPLRVAVVGSGAAGCACGWGLLARNEIAEEMLGRSISVDVFDLSATPGGRVAASPVPELPNAVDEPRRAAMPSIRAAVNAHKDRRGLISRMCGKSDGGAA